MKIWQSSASLRLLLGKVGHQWPCPAIDGAILRIMWPGLESWGVNTWRLLANHTPRFTERGYEQLAHHLAATCRKYFLGNQFYFHQNHATKLEYDEELFTILLSVLLPSPGPCPQEHPQPMTDRNRVTIPAPSPLWWYNSKTHGPHWPSVEFSFIFFVTSPLFISFLSLSHFPTWFFPSHAPGVFWDNLPNKLILNPYLRISF